MNKIGYKRMSARVGVEMVSMRRNVVEKRDCKRGWVGAIRGVVAGIVIGLVGGIMGACKPTIEGGKTQKVQEYTSCYVANYGKAYDSIPYPVVALDLYSDGLRLNEQNKIEGSGSNLYISDVFLSEEVLEDFLANRLADTIRLQSSLEAAAQHFLPGMDFDGNPTGIYLLQIAESQISSIQVMDSGYFYMVNTADSLLKIEGTFYYSTPNGQGARPIVNEHHCRFEGRIEIEKKGE